MSLPPTSSSSLERPSGWRVWLIAARPATLPAALSGVVVGLGAAAGSGGPLRIDTAIGCLLVALLLQIVANFANDLSDFRRGADTPDRQGPLRVAAAGLVTQRQLEVAIGITIVLAGIVGLGLAYIGGPVLIVLGGLAVVAALAYTGGPWPYGYRGLGEVFVFVFFGLVAVVGTAYLQTLRFEWLYVEAAIPVGALITGILVVNNLRDIPTDRAAGKRTHRGHGREERRPDRVRGPPGRRVRRADPAGAAPRFGPAARTADDAAAGGAPPPDGARVRRPAAAQRGPQGDGAAGVRLRRPVRVRAALGMTQVASLRADRVAVRFRRPFATATGMWLAREAWLLRLTDADGRVGVGEAVLEPTDGETADTVLTLLVREAVASARDGRLPTGDELESHGRPGRALRAALDAARFDLDGAPSPVLLADGDGVGVNATLPFLGPVPSAEAARQAVAAGFTTLKLKVGAERETDVLVDRVRAVRQAAGPDIRIRIDANGAWTSRPRTERLEAVERFRPRIRGAAARRRRRHGPGGAATTRPGPDRGRRDRRVRARRAGAARGGRRWTSSS